MLLQLKRSLPMRNLDWALRLQADVAALRTIMASLQSTQLRFPGFCCPVTVHSGKAWTPQSPDDPLQTLGTVEHLLHWMEDFGLGGFTPSEAVLVMNAWPNTTRDVGAALSDFLTEAHAEFFYRTGFAPMLPGSRIKSQMASAVVFFCVQRHARRAAYSSTHVLAGLFLIAPRPARVAISGGTCVFSCEAPSRQTLYRSDTELVDIIATTKDSKLPTKPRSPAATATLVLHLNRDREVQPPRLPLT